MIVVASGRSDEAALRDAGAEVVLSDLRTALERRQVGYVLAVARDHQIATRAGKFRADTLVRMAALAAMASAPVLRAEPVEALQQQRRSRLLAARAPQLCRMRQ
ncbi:hypothetical protein AB0L99_45150 [Streptomyces sp. NPDC051954]|uniref:hypothetical protein n=1 Tax=Streptomyces sp. NPDC051954 TaxID=3155524 RepID=UPI003434D200